MVDRDNYDTVLDASNPVSFFSPQKYSKKRITKSYVKFGGFDYVADYNADNKNDKAYFIEKFTDRETKHVRKNKHTLYIPKQTDIVKDVMRCGFELKDKLDLIDIEYQYQYIYVFQKPVNK